MIEVLNFGISILQWFEGIRTPLLTSIFMAFHHLGNEKGYLILVPTLFFLMPKKWGIPVLATMVSLFVNVMIKDLVAEPRPSVFGNINSLVNSTSYSFPSGHAQMAATFWGIVFLSAQLRSIKVISALMIVFIGMSRIYLGEHFPTDVLAGWGLGLMIANLCTRYSDRIGVLFSEQKIQQVLVYATSTTITLILLNSSYDAIRPIGFLFGFGVTFCISSNFYPDGKSRISSRLLFSLLGMVPVIFSYYIYNLLEIQSRIGGLICGFLFFTFLGVWVGVYPLLSKKMQMQKIPSAK